MVITQKFDIPTYKMRSPIDKIPIIDRPAPSIRMFTKAKLVNTAPIIRGANFFLEFSFKETKFEKEIWWLFLPLCKIKAPELIFKKSVELFQ